MPRYEVRQLTSAPESLALESMGARLDVSVGAPALEAEEGIELVGSSSSSSLITFPLLSSSSSDIDYAIFLYREYNNGRRCFIGVCSPLDIREWPVDEPDAVTGFYRKTSGSWTFRDNVLLEQFRLKLLEHIQGLANALALLAGLAEEEEQTYDFTPSDATVMSSSLQGERSFTITRAPVVPYPTDEPVGYRLHVTCVATGTDPKIFLHRKDLRDRDAEEKERPIAVCSPGDLVDYPVDVPDDDQFPDHYRKSTFDIVTANIPLLKDGWDNIKFDVEQLATALNMHYTEISNVDVEQISPQI